MSFFKMCYFFDPRDLWNSKNFSHHGVRCCVMSSPVCSHCLCFQCEGFVSNTGRRDSRGFLCSKGRLGRKSTRFWKLHCLIKIALQSKTNDHGVILLVNMVNECSTKWNKKQLCFIDDVHVQSCCILSGPPCIYMYKKTIMKYHLTLYH